MRTILVITAALTLAACGKGEKNVTASADPGAGTANYTAEVVALSERQRNAVFFRAIRDAGLPCQGVTSSERIAATGDTPTWRARCDNSVDHLIQVTPDGTVKIVSRTTP